jgi:GntR family transcriptional regulator/MocR family aminotransferase
VEENGTSRDLLLTLDRTSGLRAGIESALRDAVRSRRLRVGAVLPSTRALAADLGVARRTVLAAYQQLAAEGYLDCRQGAAVRVAWQPPEPPAAPASTTWEPRWDLRPGRPDVSTFPRTAWIAALRRALAGAPSKAFEIADMRGQETLREALAEYLRRVRAVVAEPANLMVCAGFTQVLFLVCQVMKERGATTFAVEDPSTPRYRDVVESAGLTPVAIPCDERGLRVDLLARTTAAAVLTTPAHQYPTGVTMAAERRQALVRWAREADAYVLEDDYDGEFRYERHPIGALQALDPARVVYAGTASKTLVPGLRLGWAVPPPALLPAMLTWKERQDRGNSVADQLAFAELVTSGEFDRHVRRARLAYRSRLDRLRTAFPRVTGIAAGMQAVLPLAEPEPAVLARARRAGLALQGLSAYTFEPRDPALIIGFGTPPAHAYGPALDALAAVLSGR